MNAVGLIVEYNPFHNGHKLHAQQSRETAIADCVIAVMSGNFLQRGEPALVNKWARTHMALQGGVDLVIELPYVYATQNAEWFANGAISILNAIGVNSFCFGSESGHIQSFLQVVNFIQNHQEAYDQLIKKYINFGNSYPKALSMAFSELADESNVLDLSLPNNILGYHYVKAVSTQKSAIKPFTIKRKAAQYHDKEITTQRIASATSIREKLLEHAQVDLKSIRHVVPNCTYEELEAYRLTYGQFQCWENIFPYLKYKVLTSSLKQLQIIYEAEEGLENRIFEMMKKADSFLDFMRKCKTKRYTWTRLQRFCTHILTNTTKEEMSAITSEAPYIRVLGMNQKGIDYLHVMKKQINLPLVTTISKFHHPFLEIEKRATCCYSLGYISNIQTKLIKGEYATPPIIVK